MTEKAATTIDRATNVQEQARIVAELGRRLIAKHGRRALAGKVIRFGADGQPQVVDRPRDAAAELLELRARRMAWR
jgi:hypothetical protein